MGIVQRDSLYITLISYTGVAIGYFNKIILFTNFLTKEQVGLANILITIAVIYAQVSAIGSYNILIRFFPFFRNRENQHHGLLLAVIAFSLAGFALATLLFLIIRQPAAAMISDSAGLLADYALYVIPLALATMFYQVFEAYLRSLQINLFPSVLHELGLRLFITLSVLLYVWGMVDFPGFVVVYVLGNCLPAIVIIGYTILTKQCSLKPVGTPLFVRLRKIIMTYGIYSMFSNLSLLLLVSIDSLMVTGMISLAATGIYTTMVFMTSVILIPYRSMIKVSAPLIASYWKVRDMAGMQTLYRKATEINMVIGAGLFLLIWVNLDSLFALMPGDYATGRLVLLLLGIGKLFDMAAGLNGTILTMSKRYRYDLLFTILLVIVAVATNLIFIPRLGMNGAALASMLTIIAFNLVRILCLHASFRLQPFMIRDISVVFLMAVIMWSFSLVGQVLHILIDIPLRSALAGLLFVIPVYLLKLSPDINRLIEKTIQMIIPKK